MAISQPNNFTRSIQAEQPFGIRVSLRPEDPFARLVGADWQKVHWFASEHERDEALGDMSRRHRFSRVGDEPALSFAKVERLGRRRIR